MSPASQARSISRGSTRGCQSRPFPAPAPTSAPALSAPGSRCLPLPLAFAPNLQSLCPHPAHSPCSELLCPCDTRAQIHESQPNPHLSGTPFPLGSLWHEQRERRVLSPSFHSLIGQNAEDLWLCRDCRFGSPVVMTRDKFEMPSSDLKIQCRSLVFCICDQ